jgi:glyoxylate reductase
MFNGAEIAGTTLGILGMGRIGRAIARRAAGFSMRVLYCNRNRLPPDQEGGAQHVALAELLAQSDHLVLVVPYSPSVHHIIGSAQLALMKPTAVLVNIARGGVVDDAALVAALGEGRIAAAGLDVYENEPALHPGFLALENVVLTPHIASSTRGTRIAMATLAADNARAALAGQVPPSLLNPEVLPNRRR